MESRQLDDQGHRVSVKVTAAVMATLVLTLGADSSSWADGGTGGCGVTSCNIGGGSGGGGGGSGGGSGGGGGGGSGSGQGGGCANTYRKVSDRQLADLQRQGPGALPAQPALGPGQTAELYNVYDCNGNPTGQIVYIVSGGGAVGTPTPAVNPAALAARALKNIPLPPPHIHMNPDATQDQLVGLPIWLWVDANDLGTKSDIVTAGPVTVVGTLNATNVVFNMGNGDVVTCNGAGTPYDPANPSATPPCGYSYKHSSAAQPNEAYTVTASVTWAGTYTVTGAPGGGPLGPVTRTSTSTVRVAEGQAINNG